MTLILFAQIYDAVKVQSQNGSDVSRTLRAQE